MTNNSLTRLTAALLALTLVGAGGCSKKYEHKILLLDGPVAKEVIALLGTLQKFVPDETALKAAIRDQLAPGLAPQHVIGIEPALSALAKTKDAKLVQLDRFGKVLRAGFRATDPDAPQPKDRLLLLTDETPPRWIKPH